MVKNQTLKTISRQFLCRFPAASDEGKCWIQTESVNAERVFMEEKSYNFFRILSSIWAMDTKAREKLNEERTENIFVPIPDRFKVLVVVVRLIALSHAVLLSSESWLCWSCFAVVSFFLCFDAAFKSRTRSVIRSMLIDKKLFAKESGTFITKL